MKWRCYRYIVPPSPHYQSYFAEPPYKDGDCRYYVMTTEREIEEFKKRGGSTLVSVPKAHKVAGSVGTTEPATKP